MTEPWQYMQALVQLRDSTITMEEYRRLRTRPTFNKDHRCESTYMDARCLWVVGHHGPHNSMTRMQSDLVWSDAGAAVEIRTPAVERALLVLAGEAS